ncbi:MAG TPA: hypothetical protein VM056_05255 [Terriglobales bacterium]|nr:hypothetical protein [Terriglobales bacterium]
MFLFLTCSLMAGAQSTPASSAGTTNPGAGAPTLADLARKNRKAKSTKVITSEDMKAADPNAMPATVGQPGRATNPGDAAADGAKGEGKEAPPLGAKRQEALAAAQAKVDQLKQLEEGLTMDVNKLETSIAEGGEFRRNSLGDVLEKNKTELAETQKQRSEAEKQVEKLKAPPKKK